MKQLVLVGLFGAYACGVVAASVVVLLADAAGAFEELEKGGVPLSKAACILGWPLAVAHIVAPKR